MTFRFNGHLIGDAGGYIDKAEYAEALTHDPVPILRKRLIADGVASEDELVAIEQASAAAISGAVEAAYAAAYPDILELKRDVFARSEEHTSELQSLMRISYAVFCLKKKNKNDNHKPTNSYLK